MINFNGPYMWISRMSHTHTHTHKMHTPNASYCWITSVSHCLSQRRAGGVLLRHGVPTPVLKTFTPTRFETVLGRLGYPRNSGFENFKFTTFSILFFIFVINSSFQVNPRDKHHSEPKNVQTFGVET